MLSDSIFWIDVDKIKPNPYQPRRDFDETKLQELAESIRQYGILQPLVVTRREIEMENGGIATEYELIAGERRLRASRLAGVFQVPVIIRTGTEEESGRIKLELAIIENIQREDLSPIDRARAFKQLVDEFNFKHGHIAQKIGKSREYVSNSIRILMLPDDIISALAEGKISDGHTRPLLMLLDRPEEQTTLLKEIIYKKLTVREAERIARHIAADKVRRRTEELDPEFLALEQKLTENLGTRVQIERREEGGKVTINFFSNDDLRQILDYLKAFNGQKQTHSIDSGQAEEGSVIENDENEVIVPEVIVPEMNGENEAREEKIEGEQIQGSQEEQTQESQEEQKQAEDDDLYSIRNFTI